MSIIRIADFNKLSDNHTRGKAWEELTDHAQRLDATSLPAFLVALLLVVVTTATGLSALTKRRALARLRKRAGCAPLRILPSGRLHLLLIKSRKQANLLTCSLPPPPPPAALTAAAAAAAAQPLAAASIAAPTLSAAALATSPLAYAAAALSATTLVSALSAAAFAAAALASSATPAVAPSRHTHWSAAGTATALHACRSDWSLVHGNAVLRQPGAHLLS